MSQRLDTLLQPLVIVAIFNKTTKQGCPQDVKSQDRDGQPSRPRHSIFSNSQDGDETLNPQDRDETEMFHFPKLRDRDVQPSRPRRDQDIPKNV